MHNTAIGGWADEQHRAIARPQLRFDEGTRSKPYRCPAGYLTIGVGRNLEAKGLAPDEIALCLENDITEAERDARALFPSFDQLSATRRAVLLNMAFNMGRDRLAGFRDLRAAIERADYAAAALAMKKSKWFTDVGERAARLMLQMIKG